MGKKEKVNDLVKLGRLRAKYFLHQFFRRIHASHICFFISISLSLFILFPSLFQSIPILEMANQTGIFQHKLSLSGELLLRDDIPVEYPIRISIGGYSVQITDGNSFSLVFLSATKSNIPVIISDNSGRYFLAHLTFDSNNLSNTFYLEWSLGD